MPTYKKTIAEADRRKVIKIFWCEWNEVEYGGRLFVQAYKTT